MAKNTLTSCTCKDVEHPDWNLWGRMKEAVARMGFVSKVVARHYLEGLKRGY